MTFVVFEIKVLKEIVYRIRFNRNIVVSGDVSKIPEHACINADTSARSYLHVGYMLRSLGGACLYSQRQLYSSPSFISALHGWY